jgi:glutamate-ammonia-ligase adenylyltransferase
VIPDHPRGSGLDTRLARLGFSDVGRAAGALSRLGPDADELVGELAGTADPALALAGLERLAEAQASAGALFATLRREPGLRSRLLAILGASAALGDFLARHPDAWQLLGDDDAMASRPTAYGLRRTLLAAVGADPDDPLPWGSGGATATDDSPRTLDRLRTAYRCQQVLLAGLDLTVDMAVRDVAAELSDLAAAALEAALAVAAAGSRGSPVRLAVVAMGKCGARELNYASDVDLIFVAEALPGRAEDPALVAATRLAEGLVRACTYVGEEGQLFPVDVGLRPEGRDGPLVRSLPSHLAYYQRWARTWEFQALLKARPVAGDLALGNRFRAQVSPLVWEASSRPDFVDDVQEMRRRVERSVPTPEVGRQIKLGPGGLRDVEFAVQLLQLVHGRADESLRAPDTLSALEALTAGGYIGRDDGEALTEAYCWLRRTEHRLQLRHLRRTQTVPRDEAGRTWLARSLGYSGRREFDEDWARRSVEVRRLHEKLFYRPLLTATARLRTDDIRMSPQAAEGRLAALGFADTAGALRHIEALTTGLSRRAAIQRALLPVLLADVADSADPDAGLLAFRQVSEALGDTPWYLRLLRDAGSTAQRLAQVLARSRYAADLLARAPESMALLGDDAALVPRPRAALAAELDAVAERNPDDVEGRAGVARALRRQELFRISSADVLGRLDVTAVGAALTDVTGAALEAGLRVAMDKVAADTTAPAPGRLSVLALGRFGGGEPGYASDADVLFVYDPLPGADDPAVAAWAQKVAEELRTLLAQPAPDPPLVVDAGLRPEGRAGPLARSLSAYAAYYARWSRPWEAQALLRAAPAAGDPELAARFLVEVADPVRYPASLSEEAVTEVRRLKRRMELERVAAGTRDRALKMGAGGLADVEWVAQLLALRHAHAVPTLRVSGTVPVLRAAAAAGLLDPEDAEVLTRAWLGAAAARNALTQVSGRPGDVLPDEGRVLAGVSRLLGYPPGEAGAMLDDYRRRARRARGVVERLVYGPAGPDGGG